MCQLAGYGGALALLTGTAAGPSAPSGALRTSWAGALMGSALEGLRLHARKSSPSVRKMAQNRWFVACRAKSFAEMPVDGRCWASFFADRQPSEPVGELCYGVGLVAGPIYWQC